MAIFAKFSASAEQVVFSEIQYHPRGDAPEYIEILNLTGTPLDVARWALSDGVTYEFPDFDASDPGRTFLGPFERILVSPVDEATLRAAYAIPAATRVYGPWAGALSNGGERLVLEDKNGVVKAEVTFGDDGRKWPISADGAGHTLRLVRKNRGGGDWRNWGASLVPDGTPGAASVGEVGQTVVIADLGSVWKYDQSGANHGTAWRDPAFDDSAWQEGPGIFGKESAFNIMPDPGFQTPWTIGGRYTYYLRKEFEWDGAFQSASIQMDGVFDDGVVVYLNGHEVGRNSMPAGAVDWQTPGTSNEATYELIVQGDISGLLEVGRNVLAVEVHNMSEWSSDIVFGADVSISTVPPDLIGMVRLSEVHLDGSGRVDWVELYAPGEQAVAVDGFVIASLPDLSDAVTLAGSVPAGGYASWDVSFPTTAGGGLDIYIASGGTVIDAHRFEMAGGEEGFQSQPPGGEWFRGGGHSRDVANSPVRNTDIVINEVMYDAPSDSRNAEFVELYNRGATTVDLGGWRFVEGVGFDFPAGTTIAPGGYLVVAADAARMASIHGAIPVVGDFSGQLRDSGELLRLEDAAGNLVDEVDYLPSGDWPELADGDGSSMELRHPDMDNGSPSAWADSDEGGKTSMQTFSYTADFEQVTWLPLAGAQELHMHLVGDSHLVVENVSLQPAGGGANLISNPDVMSPTNSSASGWVCQGTHWASYVDAGQLHLISDGHGDNKANRAEIDIGALSFGASYTLSFDARWVSGKSRLIAQTLDHGFGTSFRLPIPDNLGTPGSANSRLAASPPPSLTGVLHSPAVPSTADPVKVTVRVGSAAALASVEVVHRLDTTSGDGAWSRTAMHDDGASGGDVRAGDGVYTATITAYSSQADIVQFYVEAAAAGGGVTMQPKLGPARPAMWIVDDREMPDTLLRERFVISQYDRNALVASAGDGPTYGYNFPRMSNHFFNATFIANESEVFYNAEIRKSGSPFTRSAGSELSHGKWKLPGDRLFRERRRNVFDPSGTAEGGTPRFYDDRLARYFLYLLGHPTNEMEFVHWVVNGDGFRLRENHEPISNDFLDRHWEGGSEGALLRVDDEWRFTSDDGDAREARNADWSYKGSDDPVRYHSEWLMRTREADHDYGSFIEFVQTLSADSFDQATIDRLADRDMLCINAAVRGYDADWDTLTLNRGKNAYFFRPKGGRWMLFHWDGDRVFANANEVILGSLPRVRTYFDKPYVRRVMNYYLTELLEEHTQGSARTEAWMDMEVAATAGTGINMTKSHYMNWFVNREASARNFIGAPLNVVFAITSDASPTAADAISLTGTAPSQVYDVRVAGQPWAVSTWVDTTTWMLSGVSLMAGVNSVAVEGVDHEGRVVHTETFTITKTNDGSPVMALAGSPASFNLSVGETLGLDAGASFDPEGGALSFAWEVAPAAAVTLSPAGAAAAARFGRPGLYRFTVTGTDGQGNSAAVTREAAVYGGEGFSRFGGDRLEAFWDRANVGGEGNTVAGSWYSLEFEPGALLISVPGDRAYPLGLPLDSLPGPANYIALGDTWRYDDTNVDRGEGFAAPGYDDSGWASGAGIFGFDSGAFPAPGLNTPLAKDQDNNLLTYYFRREFQFDADPVGSQVSISAVLDDGVRFWINGSEVETARVRMPEEPATGGWWKTPASANVPPSDERVLLPVATFDGSGLLVTGTNVIAAALHNADSGSSDAVFDMTLDIAARPISAGGSGIEGATNPWVKRDLPDLGDWILQTSLGLPGLQFGDFVAGLLVEVESGGVPGRYGIGYRNGDELAVVQVAASGGVGVLFSLPYVLSREMVVRIRREGNELIFEWRPGDLFEEVYRLALPAGSTAVAGGAFAATGVPQAMAASFDYVMLIDPASVSDSAGDLVVTEIMYKPVGGSAYEFIELYNAGPGAIDLAGYRFPQGEPFDEFVFGDVTVEPGGYVLVVNDLAAFRSRYGTGLDSSIAGEWAGGALSNSGELVTLLDTAGDVVLSFEYSDSAPWPTSPDSGGVSLVLIDPTGGNGGTGADWTASLLVGGTPGAPPTGGDFAAWMAARGEVDPLATRQGEVVNNLLTYAFGVDLAGGDLAIAMPAVGVVEVGGVDYLTYGYRRRSGAPGVGYQLEVWTDGAGGWVSASSQVVEVGVTDEGDGTERVVVRLSDTFGVGGGVLLRVRVVGPGS